MGGGLIRQHFRQNIWQYLILILVFTVGFIIGDLQVSGLGTGTRNHLLKLLDQFTATPNTLLNGLDLFLDAVLQQAKIIGIVWFLGLTVVGVPLTLALIGARGLSLGFTIGFLLEEKGRAGMILSLITVLPQNLFYIPMLVAAAALSFNFSIFVIRGQIRSGAELWQNFFVYSLLMFGLFVICVLGAAVEAFLSPYLLNSLLA